MILSGENALFLEELYQTFRKDARLVPPEWSHYFQQLELSNGAQNVSNGAKPTLGLSHPSKSRQAPHSATSHTIDYKDVGVQSLTESYRRFGNLAAKLDPLGLQKKNRKLLELEHYGLSANDLEREFSSPLPGLKRAKLTDIIRRLEASYCDSIGIEYAYIRNTEERDWLEERMEAVENSHTLDLAVRRRLYEKLVQAETFEKFLAQKYVGKKRFSIEGCEGFIPLLDRAIEQAAGLGVKCIVMGMAHRGRLNVLVNIMQKPTGLIFAEFDENYDPETLDYADVKYHLGYSFDRPTLRGQSIHLSLAFNPSHLEAVNPVVLGSIRARQTKHQDSQGKAFMPIIVHGDAAFMGQGVVAETLNLCNLAGYSVGGSLHVLINNQIGFTTLPPESRSTEFATDLAKGFQIPIFHVNADDPEAIYRATNLSLEYRQRFSKDVIIDLIGYRRLGHNETDEPAFTQPLMYAKIKKHPTAVQVYRKKLLEYPDIAEEDLQFIEKGCRAGLEDTFNAARIKKTPMAVDTMKGAWADFTNKTPDSQPKEKLLDKQLEHTAQALTQMPSDFHLHPKLKRLLDNRKKMYKGEIAVDWGFAESLAFGSILENKHNIRISGQDVKRGTFSHRHCVLVDIETGKEYLPLNHISDKQGHLEAHNSPLSEFSVLGFEYGYTLADPHSMVIWEAQFGDFANGAQIIFDQFICSSEVKWQRLSGLVVLLPHGYEGQGPEHSSARLERFLQLCANQNIQVCNCSTPAQYFHLLRRQILCKFRKPLIIMTPKSLLRLSEAGSHISEIRKGSFQEFLYAKKDPPANAKKVERILLCSGKIYYELESYRLKQKRENVRIGRVEQLYPFPREQLQEFLQLYSNVREVFWVQEGPINQGGWYYIENYLKELLGSQQKLSCVARPESASPAAGLLKVHQKEQIELLAKAID